MGTNPTEISYRFSHILQLVEQINLMSNIQTKDLVSAGGVVFRRKKHKIEIILISVGETRRWQLPKGLINKGEEPKQTALREVREETGIDSSLLDPIDKIEYWYYGQSGSKRIRYHKTVHFYLLKFLSGDTKDHDQEVEEARWVEIDEAQTLLAFKSEQEIVGKAKMMIHDRIK
jgi:8-oxo-dGTP pyrophosphatase MutT (NUDIX family)